MKNNPIGILDSGIGGVTVLKEILKILPNENYIYYSDSINNPYGEKTCDEVLKYVYKIMDFFVSKKCKAVVFACNTATALTINEVREKYKDLIIVGIEPAYKMVHDYLDKESTLVMATNATINSDKFLKLFHNYDNGNTTLLACGGLADLIEKNDTLAIKKYLKEKLNLDKKYTAVVLGCTHYPLIKKEISEVLGDVIFFDGASGVSKRLKNLLINKDLLNLDNTKPNIKFYDSSNNISKEIRFFEMLN